MSVVNVIFSCRPSFLLYSGARGRCHAHSRSGSTRRSEAQRGDEFPFQLTAWEISSGKLLWQRPLAASDTDFGRLYAVSPDGTTFAAAGPGGRFQVLDLAEAPDEAVGQTLGRHKLLERAGEGGCGMIYDAAQ